jgi:hypothetical protein
MVFKTIYGTIGAKAKREAVVAVNMAVTVKDNAATITTLSETAATTINSVNAIVAALAPLITTTDDLHAFCKALSEAVHISPAGQETEPVVYPPLDANQNK